MRNLVWELGDLRVDRTAFRVTRGGQPVPLEPKALQLLIFLIENRGRLVEKSEILETVWKETVVTENAMTRVVADLRKALGDHVREARFIETVPTRGYRFIGEVREAPSEDAPRPVPAPEPVVAPRGPRAGRVAWAVGALATIVLGVVGVRHRGRAPANLAVVAPPPARQVTNSLGLDLAPSFSPDGAQIAYCSDRGAGFEVFVKQFAPGAREIQITADGQNNVQPAWSPDGRQIAYASRGRPGIWLVPALGGSPRRLTDFGSRPAWSPDGTAIAFQSQGPTTFDATTPSAAPPSTLFLVAVAGGAPVPLTHTGNPPGGHGAPAFSPDGRTVAFSSWAPDESGIWTVSRSDGRLQRVLPTGKDSPFYFDPVYSPRGHRLYFSTAPGPWANASLVRVAVPGPGGTWGAPEPVAPAGPISLRQAAISPRDGSIAYAGISSTSNLWSLAVDPRTALATAAPALLTRATGCRNTLPAFSPDGSRIAYLSCEAGMANNVWVMDRDGRNAEQVTSDPKGVGPPAWLPDGRRIAFQSLRDGTAALWAVTPSDRSTKRMVSVGNLVTIFRLSPDGRSLAGTMHAPEGTLQVFVVPVDGGPPRRVTNDPEGAGYAAWSPDGRDLAIELVRGSDWRIAVVPAAGGKTSPDLTHEGLSWLHDWSPDGERILFAGLRRDRWNVFWVSRHGGSEHRLTDYASTRSFVRFPAWSPRGDQVVYEYAETNGNIWMSDLDR